MMQPVGRLGYRPSLDGLRGVAILLVVVRHAAQWPSGGFLGVDLFFVLSGFLITTLLLQEHRDRGSISLRLFYARRGLRLLPALGVMLAAYVIVSVASGSDPGAILARAAIGASYTANLLAAWWPGVQQPPLRHLWSLAMEEQFYIVWPIVLVLVARFARRHLQLVLLVAIALVWTENLRLLADGELGARIYMGPDTRALPLLVGCLVGSIVVGTTTPKIPGWTTAFAVAVAAPLVLFLRSSEPLTFSIGIPLFATATAVVIVATLAPSKIGRLLSWRPLVQLGGISYALYLWHPLTLLAVGSPAGHPNGLLRPVAGVAAAVALAIASRVLVERPFLRLKSRLRTEDAVPSPAPSGYALKPAAS